jgi:hypothetical protein
MQTVQMQTVPGKKIQLNFTPFMTTNKGKQPTKDKRKEKIEQPTQPKGQN